MRRWGRVKCGGLLNVEVGACQMWRYVKSGGGVCEM